MGEEHRISSWVRIRTHPSQNKTKQKYARVKSRNGGRKLFQSSLQLLSKWSLQSRSIALKALKLSCFETKPSPFSSIASKPLQYCHPAIQLLLSSSLNNGVPWLLLESIRLQFPPSHRHQRQIQWILRLKKILQLIFCIFRSILLRNYPH